LKKGRHSSTVEYPHNRILFSLKKKEILILATIQMNSEEILSEIRQTQKEKFCRIPLV
jgi:hypothetical protein